MTTALLLVHLGIVIAFTLRILLRHDLTPQTRLAWFVVLTLLPVIGSIIYLLFGEIDPGDKANKSHTRIHALICAAKRGVTCRAMADEVGSRALVKSGLWADMRAAGVRLAVAFPLDSLLTTILFSRIDLRNHRKITVIDGAITYCGSQNAADPEFRVKPKYAPWVDRMLRFQGPVVAQNQMLFANAIARAQSQLTISTPYFVPDATVFEALCAAAWRGVEVTLIFPQNNDSWIVAAASRNYYRKLLEAGCVIHEYVGGLLHAKTLTIDGQISFIGSSNIDLRSFDLNYENNILLQDAALTSAIAQRQAEYIKHAKQVSLPEVQAWSKLKRIWNNTIATVGPIL